MIAAVAVLAVAGGIASDIFADGFWQRHALLAGLTASVLVVMVSVAILNEAIELRRRRRWRVLAQYVMLQLVAYARSIWTDLAELGGLMPSHVDTAAAVEGGSRCVRETPDLTRAFENVIAEPRLRRELRERIAHAAIEGDELVARWAPIMLNADEYAELIDRHVELATELYWIDGLLSSSCPTIEKQRWQQSRNHPAGQIEGDIDDQHLARRVGAMTRLAEELDRVTLGAAGRILPVQWWADRLGATPPAWTAGWRQQQPTQPPPGDALSG